VESRISAALDDVEGLIHPGQPGLLDHRGEQAGPPEKGRQGSQARLLVRLVGPLRDRPLQRQAPEPALHLEPDPRKPAQATGGEQVLVERKPREFLGRGEVLIDRDAALAHQRNAAQPVVFAVPALIEVAARRIRQGRRAERIERGAVRTQEQGAFAAGRPRGPVDQVGPACGVDHRLLEIFPETGLEVVLQADPGIVAHAGHRTRPQSPGRIDSVLSCSNVIPMADISQATIIRPGAARQSFGFLQF
jgi:hypothetical protein